MDRRSHYLDVALRLFISHGYHGVSVDQVVAEAGGSKATLYRYFSSKRELFEAIIEDIASAALPPEMSGDLARLDLPAALDALGTRIASAALSEQAVVLLRLAIGEGSRFPELGLLLFERGPGVSYDRFGDFVRERVAAGELEVPNVEIASEQFISGIVGHQQLRMALGVSTPSPQEITDRIHYAVVAFLAAYAGSPVGGGSV